MRVAFALIVLSLPGVAMAQHYRDGSGREWRQVNTLVGLSWTQVASVCPTDGVSPCTGTVSGQELSGWIWASRDEVRDLFAEFSPEMGDVECVGGPAYVLPALSMLGGGVINPTFSFYTTFGGSLYLNGWTSSLSPSGGAFMASASARYPVFDGSLCVSGVQDPATTPPFTGVWLWRPIACDSPVVTSGPANAVTCGHGQSVRFTVEVDTTGTARFQWRQNGEPIPGAENPTALTPGLVVTAMDEAGVYDCVVTDRCGSVTSETAELVLCRADFDCSGGVDGDDVITFFAAWDGADASADLTGDGGVDGDDVIGFFARWDAGC